VLSRKDGHDGRNPKKRGRLVYLSTLAATAIHDEKDPGQTWQGEACASAHLIAWNRGVIAAMTAF
jgi:hypothetical protein